MDELLFVGALEEINDVDMDDAIVHEILNLGNNGRNYEFQFNLNEMNPDEVKRNFRFNRDDIFRLAQSLRLPEEIRTIKRHVISGVDALCIVLRRLAYPNRLSDLSSIFGLSSQSLSLIINTTINLIINNHERLLNNLSNLHWLNRDRIALYAEAIANKGAALENCWGFIDGTTRAMCRPSREQENYYSGHKRYHCLKYQSVLCPDGMITSLKGPYEGRRHDAGIFRESGLNNELERIARFPDGQRYVLFGDQAYGITELLICPYAGRPENQPHQQRNFNAAMSGVRIAVEWGYQKIVQQFAFVDFKKNQKLLQQDLEQLYKTAVLLTNCHTCLYGSQSSEYFNIFPPTLEQY